MTETELFDRAINMPPADRAALLDRECAEKPELRARLDRLLAADVDIGVTAAAPLSLADPGGTASPVPSISLPGTVIAGKYKLLERIGEGGMGEVWVADQLQPIKRRVALKLIKPGMDSRSVLGRFEAERQALAVMDHPNIAKVLDAGTTSDGRPYFVMELVKGTPITEFCDARKLTPNQRLELFVPVCQAIQHAHMKGIIHRDIKPSNVLVALHDETPVPKVIDFGVAKAIGQQLTEKTIYTGFGALIGTPAYMAPEQATFNQLDVDTRADVYSLGVLLYELLAGSPPIEQERLKKAALDELLRIVRDEEPQRPSQRLSTSQAKATIAATRQSDPAKLSALMKGEIDWIVMKALEKDRTRRYDTANGLAKDIQRYLRGDSVEACPPTIAYRMKKFIDRNWAEFWTAAFVMIIVFMTTALSLRQAVHAMIAETIAKEQRDEAVASEEKALTAQKMAAEERDAANAARNELRRTHYAASMSLIGTAWESDNVARAVELLEENRPKPGEADLRGFEWYYWDRLCHAEKRTVTINENARLASDIFCGDGSRILQWQTVVENPQNPKSYVCAVRILNVASGREVTSYKFPLTDGYWQVWVALNHNCSRVAFLPQGNNGPGPLPLVVYNVATWEEIFRTTDCTAGSFSFNREGTRLATVQGPVVAYPEPNDRGRGPNWIRRWTNVKIWDLSRPEKPPVVIANDREDGINTLSPPRFTPDGSGFAFLTSEIGTTEADEATSASIRVWDVATGHSRINHAFPLGNTSIFEFSPDGSRFATAGSRPPQGEISTQHEVTLYEGGAGVEVKAVKSVALRGESSRMNFNRFRMTFSPDGQRLALTDQLQPTKVIDFFNGTIVQKIMTPTRVVGGAFLADGTRFVTVGWADSVSNGIRTVLQEWSIPMAKPVPAATISRERVITSENGRRTATHIHDLVAPDPPDPHPSTDVTIRDAAGTVIRVFKKHTKPIIESSISPDGRWVYTYSQKGNEYFLWEADSGDVRWSSQKTADPAYIGYVIARFSPDGRWLAANVGGEAKLFSVPDFQEPVTLGKDALFFFSPDSRRLICEESNDVLSSTAKYTETLWDLETGQRIKSYPSRLGNSGSTQFSPDSQLFALTSFPSTGIFDAVTGKLRATLPESPRRDMLAFSPDGTRVAFAGNNLTGGVPVNSSAVFDTFTGALLFRLEGHSTLVRFIAYSSDSRYIATVAQGIGTRRLEVKLWDAATGRELITINKDTIGNVIVSGLRFSPDGHKLIVKQSAAVGPKRILTPIDELIWDATPRAEPGK